ncbi:MAG: glycosyltransferase [Verrucomicrobiota bacterium]
MVPSGKSLVLFTSLPKVGGHSTLTLGLCRMLKPDFSSVHVWCKVMPEHGHSPALQKKLEDLGCRVHLLSDESGRLLLPALARLIWSFLTNPPDVFFTLAMRHLSPLLAFFSRARVRVYYQITHDMKLATIRTIRAYARVFTKIVFICPATFEDCPDTSAHQQKYSWIPQSSEIPVTNRQALPVERKAAAEGTRIRFGLIGRLTAEKGAEVIRDFACADGSNCEIHVAGSGPFEASFRELAACADKPGRPVVRFHGAFDPADREAFLRRFFSGIDYLIVPSQDEWETLSMAALESLQHGVPAVICRTGGLRSFAHPDLGPAPENVIRLVEPNELAATLDGLSLLPRPSWIPTGPACLAHYDRYFSNAAILNRWRDLLVPKRAGGREEPVQDAGR